MGFLIFLLPWTIFKCENGSVSQNSIYLQIILRVPVTIINNNCICSCQVDTQTTSFCTQQEHKTIRVWLAKPVNCSLAQIATDTSIYPFKWISGTQTSTWNQQYNLTWQYKRAFRDLEMQQNRSNLLRNRQCASHRCFITLLVSV